MRILVISNDWPDTEHPERIPFVVKRVEYLQRAGVEVSVFSFRGRKNPFNYLRAWFRLRRQYCLREFDLIHVQFGQAGILALPAPRPVVITFYGSDLQGFVGREGKYTFLGKVSRFVSRFVARRVQQVIVVAERMVHYLPDGIDYKIIPTGVDCEMFYPMPQAAAREGLELPPDKYFVLFGANPKRPEKRFYLAQEAIQLLQNEYDVELIALEGVDHARVPFYMNACDALVLTSQHEGSPTVVKEACACGLAVVSVDVGDVRKQIGAIDGCVVCCDDSARTIADALAGVLRSRKRIEATEFIATVNEKKLAEDTMVLYQSLLS